MKPGARKSCGLPVLLKKKKKIISLHVLEEINLSMWFDQIVQRLKRLVDLSLVIWIHILLPFISITRP